MALAMTVTATQGGSVANGLGIVVKVLTGASQPGATSGTTRAGTNLYGDPITPQATGSLVYGTFLGDTAANWVPFDANTAAFTQNVLVGSVQFIQLRSAATTTAATPVTLGCSSTTVNGHSLCLCEIKAAGTLAEDASAPAVSGAVNATTWTSASFTPPPGALLVAQVTSSGLGGVVTMTVSGGGLAWTEQVLQNATGQGYTGIWTAQVPLSVSAVPFYAPRWHPGRGLPGLPGGTPFWVPPSPGVPAAAAVVDTPLTDAGTSAEALVLTQPTALTDAGTSAEALTVTAAVPLTEAGTSTEAVRVTQAIALTDAGTSAEVLGVSIPVALTDAGSGTDVLVTPLPYVITNAVGAFGSSTYNFPVGTAPGLPDGVTVAFSTGGASPPAVTAFTDSKGNTYTLRESATGATPYYTIYTCQNLIPLTTSDTFNITFSFATPSSVAFLAVGTPRQSLVDAAVAADGSSTAPAVTGTPGPGEAVLGLFGWGNLSGNGTITAPFTLLDQAHSTGAYSTAAYLINSVAGVPLTAAATISTNAWHAVLLSFSTAPYFQEAGASTEAPAVTAAVPLADTGTSAEALALTQPIALTDAGTSAEALGVSIPVALTDAGTSTEALAVALAIPLTDAGTSTEALAVSAAVPLTDAGSSTEALAITQPTALTDAGISAEVLGALVPVALTDTGTSTEALGVALAIALTDSGISAEALAVTSSVPLTEAGTSAEAVRITQAIALTDAGTSAESPAVTQPTALADAGTSAEALAVALAIALTDSGTSAEALAVSAAVPLTEAGISVEAVKVTQPTALADAGTSAEALAVTAAVPLTEAGTSTEALAVALAVPLTDAGTSAEAVRVTQPTAFAEGGTSAEALAIAQPAALADAGTSTEALALTQPTALTDAGTSAEAFAFSTGVPKTDPDTGYFGDAEIFTVATQADVAAGADASQLTVQDSSADTASAAEAASVLVTGTVFVTSTDTSAATDAGGWAGPLADSDSWAGADTYFVTMPPASDTEAGAFAEGFIIDVWAALPPDPHPGGGYGVVFGRGTPREVLILQASHLSVPLLHLAREIRALEAAGGTVERVGDSDAARAQEHHPGHARVEVALYLGDGGQSVLVQARASGNGSWESPELLLNGVPLEAGPVHPVLGYVTARAPASAGRWVAQAILPGTDVVAEQELTIAQT